MESLPIYSVLASVTDKTNLAEFITKLKVIISNLKVIASGFSAQFLSSHNLDPTLIADYTGFKECFSGRVKTLHPKIAGGILLDKEKDLEEAKKLGIEPIDMVICNFYDFKVAIEKNLSLDELIEFIDVGGPTLIRAAAKNFKNVAVISSIDDYDLVAEEIKKSNGCISIKTRFFLATKAFQLTADYEMMIAAELSKRLNYAPVFYTALHNQKKLRYGENPDQEGWVYQLKSERGIAHSKALTGKPLSYNNYEDATIALNAATDLKQLLNKAAVAIVKHGSLCGFASADTMRKAFELAWDGDSKSAFGSVVAVNGDIDKNFSGCIENKFIEVIVAGGFSDTFVEWVSKHKPMLRLISSDFIKEKLLYKKISGGMLIQTPSNIFNMQDINKLLSKSKDLKKGVVTKLMLPIELNELVAFSIVATKYVKSNAIVIAREVEAKCYQTVGIGSGQPNRVDSMELLAIPKAIKKTKDISDCVLASDGFFPFSDNIDSANKANVKWIVQPGGSKKDEMVIERANQYQMGMVFTGQRFFSH